MLDAAFFQTCTLVQLNPHHAVMSLRHCTVAAHTDHSDITCKKATVTVPGRVTLTDIIFNQQASVTGLGHTGVSVNHNINAKSKFMHQYKHHQEEAVTCIAKDKIENIQVLALEDIAVLAM